LLDALRLYVYQHNLSFDEAVARQVHAAHAAEATKVSARGSFVGLHKGTTALRVHCSPR
jgi:hypothetical protein